MSTAVIIPFPTKVSGSNEQERLRQALTDLQAALSDQKRALSDWRFAMAELGVGVAGLGQALGSYHTNLGVVDAKLGGLRSEAVELENWADNVIAGEASRVG